MLVCRLLFQKNSHFWAEKTNIEPMIEKTYDLRSNGEKTLFAFKSIGPRGEIQKIIQLVPLAEPIWNLGFGDIKNGKVSDSAISNNEDLVRVIATVAQAAMEFSATWPGRKIQIEPIDEKRKQLYAAVFKRHFSTISGRFLIESQIQQNFPEEWAPDLPFDRLILTPLFPTFVKK